jgi:rare lipoprotein A
MRSAATLSTVIFSMTLLANCASTAPHWGRQKETPVAHNAVFVESGTASYYSKAFVNKKTANGERYKPEIFTTAHPSLPFGTLLLVKRKNNGKYVIVRVNDRGPFIKGRIVDLSLAAAKKLGMITQGRCDVDIYKIPSDSRLAQNL